MKKIIILLAFTLVSCYNQERNCANFKTGSFTFTQEIEGKSETSTFERNDSLQIETFRGKTDTLSVRWINDCEYVVKNINPKNRAEKKAIHIKILTTNKEGYTFEYGFIGETKKQRGIVTKKD